MPVARLATAAVLISGLLAALFLLPPPGLAAAVALVLALAGFEWGRLCRFSPAAAAAYAAAVPATFAVVALGGAGTSAIALGAAFWLLGPSPSRPPANQRAVRRAVWE